MRSLLAAFVFYTILPIPPSVPLNFERVARWLPLVGLTIGALLASVDWLLHWLVPNEIRSVLVVCLWVGITAGLHVDGAMDTADGLAAGDRTSAGLQRRLAAMTDSYSGAFGVMAAILLLLLKYVALLHLPEPRWMVLLLVPAWGRWGQLLAIALYPYLKERGKGRFLKDTTRLPQDLWPSTLLLVIAFVALRQLAAPTFPFPLWMAASAAIALASGAWLYRQLGGHTGDTYGAVVEWTEAIALVAATSALP
ncbi:adenosylcobinamide-GDP ribazoletransferase [Synechococcus sp. PCC 7336]|uniref:adenosylcobinamide-GDP ribazoletransferase n=1 Tax=Synechococcus sp. PCC 7336 TaxID=195250 RepID=UPI0003459817|nr:adenosylcobinamide-GDP ribazoletransferase [Synechococcus sp. PCC 7336]